MIKPIVSIIIPTYNRSHLIIETLKSIQEQVYKNWECIIVDDHSTDDTEKIVSKFISDKPRFSLHQRPLDKSKGANACRNYGFEKSSGVYVIWFDSDDIMLPEMIDVMVKELLASSSYYIVCRYNMFVDHINQEINEPLFDMNRKNEIHGINYMMGKAFWGTINVLLTREIINDMRFDESLNSGQEYNFFTRLFIPDNHIGVFIDQVLCKRRIHDQSIQFTQNQNDESYLKNKYQLFLNTYTELSVVAPSNSIDYLLLQAMSFAYRLNEQGLNITYKQVLFNTIRSQKGPMTLSLFRLSLLLQRNFKTGYRLYKKSLSYVYLK